MDTVLRILFRITRSQRVSEVISERRLARRWAAMAAAHKAAGGVVATYESGAGSQSFLLGGNR